ncbi:MAG TPA: DUF2270 domain-containing protein [Anaerolineales bacterium]|nr:DUF2270 domain-containing protein [Anaerolineales bacterium]
MSDANPFPEGNDTPSSAHKPGVDDEPVWTFRGYRLRPSEFTTAMVHFFRAEVARANVWRQRLDTTTNWAVVSTGAAITIAFNQSAHHFVILLNALLVTLFLAIEARRYRYYELWSYRIRLMETDFFASMLVPPFHPAADWAESLAENLFHPSFPISIWEAFGRRLRRNYYWIFIVLAVAYLARIGLVPTQATSWQEFFQRGSIGNLGGEIVIAFVAVYYGLLFFTALFTVGLHQASGEVLPRFTDLERFQGFFQAAEGEGRNVRAWFRIGRRRQQLLALIITDRSQEVCQAIFKELNRGVTALQGTGMFTGKPHSVLMVALTVTEIPNLKSIVHQTDSNAFVIVSPAREILGRGFMPLQK